MYKQFSEETLLRCEFCSRTFSDTALKHHRKACTADSPAKPAGTGLGRASLSHRVVRASSPLPLTSAKLSDVCRRPRSRRSGMLSWGCVCVAECRSWLSCDPSPSQAELDPRIAGRPGSSRVAYGVGGRTAGAVASSMDPRMFRAATASGSGSEAARAVERPSSSTRTRTVAATGKMDDSAKLQSFVESASASAGDDDERGSAASQSACTPPSPPPPRSQTQSSLRPQPSTSSTSVVRISLPDLVALAKCAGAWELKQHLMLNSPNLSTVRFLPYFHITRGAVCIRTR